MDIVLWLVSALLAVVYSVSGSLKLMSPRARLLAVQGMGWVEDVPMSQVRLVGFLEIAGAIGVIVPWATGIAPLLTPLAALGLAAIQVGAIVTHVQRGENEHLAVNFVLLGAALLVAVGRVVG
jgi:uncharacterized membrane protein YphA (DoxX/SURF4 family)